MAPNIDQHLTTKPPPTPSPLRNSKFFQSNMRILVTGGAGFIGSHLVDRLMENEKNEVIVADNYFTGSKDNLSKWIGHPRFELIRHDVTEPLLVEVDRIYHLACPASPIFYKHNPVKTIKTNVMGTLNMLGLAKRVGARILLTSTSEVYGDPLVHPQPETYWGNVNPIGVRSCYDEGKRVAETLMFDYHRQHGIEIRVARIFNTYGPRMNIDDGRVVSNFIAQALRDEPLTVQAPGTQTRSFCYVSDMVVPNLSKRNFRLAVSDDFSELPNHETAAHFTVHLEAPLLPLASKDALDPDLSLKLHPIGEIIRRSRCVQVALGMSMALAVGNAWFRSESEILLSPILSVFVAFALIGGSVVVWNVKFIAKLSPLAAMEAEKAAIAAILLTYFSVVDTFLGVISGFAVLSWICLVLCFILVIV